MNYLITNGKIITENQILENHNLLIENGFITRINQEIPKNIPELQIINAQGDYVTPGMIDIHSDYIEHMAAPRPTSMMDFNMSIREMERELATHGITTMFHSLAMFKSAGFAHKPIRDPENVQKFIDLIDKIHEKQHLIRHRVHVRFEIDSISETENLKSFIKQRKVHLLSFMDHTPGQGQYRNLEVFTKTLKGYSNLSDDHIEQIVNGHINKEKLTMNEIREITSLALETGIAVASHDDDTFAKLELVKAFGTTISEFPITLEIAQQARKMGMHTIAGAPNILLGGSHSGNLSAAEAILAGSIDILCSDYYPPAMLHSIFIMHEKYNCDLAEMFRLVTINPAKAVKFDHEIGSLSEGKKADLLIIKKINDNFPVVTSVFVDGKAILMTEYRL